MHVVGVRERLAVRDPLDGSSAELERGGDADGVRRPDPHHAGQLARRCARQRDDAARAVDQRGRDLRGRVRANAGAEDDREQLVVADGIHADAPHAFAGSIFQLGHTRTISKRRATRRRAVIPRD